MRKQVLLTGAFQYSEKQFRMIEEQGWEITYVKNEIEPLKIPLNQFDAVVCNGLFLYNDITNFHNLKMVQITSAGMERIPIEYMEKHHIQYYNAKDVYSIPMAEWAVMRILEIYKNSYGFFERQQQHKWEKERTLLELTGKKVCIIGYGNVGRETAKRLAAFDTEIIAVNRNKIEKDGFVQKWIPINEIDKALPEADIIILCIALTKETRTLLNADRIELMKPGSILINISRGAVLDEKALIRQIKKKKFRGVALDVFENEPLSEDSEMWKLPGMLISPHNSFVGDKVRERMFTVILSNLKKVIVDVE